MPPRRRSRTVSGLDFLGAGREQPSVRRDRRGKVFRVDQVRRGSADQALRRVAEQAAHRWRDPGDDAPQGGARDDVSAVVGQQPIARLGLPQRQVGLVPMRDVAQRRDRRIGQIGIVAEQRLDSDLEPDVAAVAVLGRAVHAQDRAAHRGP